MNEEDLMYAVGQIGDDLIEESERKRADWKRIGIIAACMVVFIAIGWVFAREENKEIRFIETEITRSFAKIPYPEGGYDRPMTEEMLAAFLDVESFADWGDAVPSGWVYYYADGTVWKVNIEVGEGSNWMRLVLAPGEVPLTDIVYTLEIQPQDYFGVELTAIRNDAYREAWGIVQGTEIIGVRISAVGENAEERINRYAALTLGRKNTLSLDALADQ